MRLFKRNKKVLESYSQMWVEFLNDYKKQWIDFIKSNQKEVIIQILPELQKIFPNIKEEDIKIENKYLDLLEGKENGL